METILLKYGPSKKSAHEFVFHGISLYGAQPEKYSFSIEIVTHVSLFRRIVYSP